MPRSSEAASWYTLVYRAIQEVPHGSVTTYGHIALLVGYPERPRQVGTCLKYLPRASEQPDARYNSDTVPWQRVINAQGVISNRRVLTSFLPAAGSSADRGALPCRGANGAARQEAALAQEGVVVGRGDLGERTVDFSTYGWFPHRLPSEEDEG